VRTDDHLLARGPAALAALVGERVLDAELAALLWVLLDARTPVLVAGRHGSGRRPVVSALAAVLPDLAVRLPVGGVSEEFEWLPEAGALGWHRATALPVEEPPSARPETGVLVVHDLADGAAGGPDGGQARILVRALALGYGMLATTLGDTLDDVLNRLHAPAVGSDDDERSRLGVVLAMTPPDPGAAPRVAAAHYVRPVALDTHGHVQRLPPAVLATWSAAAGRWDHFAWGVLADLAGRTGRSPIDVEREQARRATLLQEMVAQRG